MTNYFVEFFKKKMKFWSSSHKKMGKTHFNNTFIWKCLQILSDYKLRNYKPEWQNILDSDEKLWTTQFTSIIMKNIKVFKNYWEQMWKKRILIEKNKFILRIMKKYIIWMSNVKKKVWETHYNGALQCKVFSFSSHWL